MKIQIQKQVRRYLAIIMTAILFFQICQGQSLYVSAANDIDTDKLGVSSNSDNDKYTVKLAVSANSVAITGSDTDVFIRGLIDLKLDYNKGYYQQDILPSLVSESPSGN